MGVRGLPTEFATVASKSVRLETRAKLAKTRFVPGANDRNPGRALPPLSAQRGH